MAASLYFVFCQHNHQYTTAERHAEGDTQHAPKYNAKGRDASMSNTANSSTTLNGQKLLGYGVAGGILLLLADVAPKVAVGTTGLILLTVALSHANQLGTLAKWIGTATGNTQKGQVIV